MSLQRPPDPPVESTGLPTPPRLLASVYVQFEVHGKAIKAVPLMFVSPAAARMVATQLEQLAKELRAFASPIVVPPSSMQ